MRHQHPTVLLSEIAILPLSDLNSRGNTRVDKQLRESSFK